MILWETTPCAGLLMVETVCSTCLDHYAVKVRPEDWERYRAGALAQNAFPYLDAEHRERLISGTCPSCWSELFGSGDE